MATTSQHRHPNIPLPIHDELAVRVDQSEESIRRRPPGGFPHLTIAFAALVLAVLAAFTLIALLDDSMYAFLGVGLAVPLVIALLLRSATRRRDQSHPSR
jgi:hypothetical protein